MTEAEDRGRVMKVRGRVGGQRERQNMMQSARLLGQAGASRAPFEEKNAKLNFPIDKEIILVNK